MQPRTHSNPLGIALQLLVMGFVVWLGFNYQGVLDQYALATFHPSADLAVIEGHMGLTQQARATFYRASPQIDDKNSFNSDCQTQPHELELGCYFRGHIFILKIDNPSLAPEMDAVTAHELLHAAWANLSASERKTLGSELEHVYQQVGTSELKQRMADYAKSEPGEEDNELHSILGTEYASLSPSLEAHYAKYFTGRGAIVAAHAAYQSVFDSRRAELERELSQIRSEKGQLGVINAQMQGYRDAGQIPQYNALVPRQNFLVDDINKRIASYRQGVDEYNALSKSLDSQQITDTETTAQ
jgi:hypothetical protein